MEDNRGLTPGVPTAIEAVSTEGRHRAIEENFFFSVKQDLLCFCNLYKSQPRSDARRTDRYRSGRHRRSAPRYRRKFFLFSKTSFIMFLQFIQMTTAV